MGPFDLSRQSLNLGLQKALIKVYAQPVLLCIPRPGYHSHCQKPWPSVNTSPAQHEAVTRRARQKSCSCGNQPANSHIVDRMSSYWTKHPCGVLADRAGTSPAPPCYPLLPFWGGRSRYTEELVDHALGRNNRMRKCPAGLLGPLHTPFSRRRAIVRPTPPTYMQKARSQQLPGAKFIKSSRRSPNQPSPSTKKRRPPSHRRAHALPILGTGALLVTPERHRG